MTLGHRPNAVALGKRVVFVSNFRATHVAMVDERTGGLRRGSAPRIGRGGVDVAPGPGSVWVAGNRQHALFRLDPATGRQIARIQLPLAPKHVAAGARAVWVAMITAVRGTPDTLALVDPRSNRVVGTYPVPEGAGALAVTPAGVWVAHRLAPAVSRFNPALGRFDKRVTVGEDRLGDLAFGAGAIWVTSPLEDMVTRIDPRTGSKVSSGVGRRPTAIAAFDSQIWVTSFIDHTITRIDPKTTRPVGEPVPVPLNPYALAVTRDSVWLTALGHAEVVRVRYAAPR